MNRLRFGSVGLGMVARTGGKVFNDRWGRAALQDVGRKAHLCDGI